MTSLQIAHFGMQLKYYRRWFHRNVKDCSLPSLTIRATLLCLRGVFKHYSCVGKVADTPRQTVKLRGASCVASHYRSARLTYVIMNYTLSLLSLTVHISSNLVFCISSCVYSKCTKTCKLPGSKKPCFQKKENHLQCSPPVTKRIQTYFTVQSQISYVAYRHSFLFFGVSCHQNAVIYSSTFTLQRSFYFFDKKLSV